MAATETQLKLPALLVIMDGFGIAPAGPGNAVSLAKKPFLDELFATCPNTTLDACGEAVGLPDGQMGNSEVGHLNIGAGRVVRQELTRINHAVADGSFNANEVLLAAIDGAVADQAAVHVMGLLSDGGVHSEQRHLEAAVRLAAERGAARVYVHAFTDGRDVPPSSGFENIARMDALCAELSAAKGADVRLVTISGRYYAMDRDKRWDRVKLAFDAIMDAKGPRAATSDEAIQASYAAGVTDEFVVPVIIGAEDAYPGVAEGDAVLFMNFRPDRARQLTRAIVDPAFDGFERPGLPGVRFVCLTEYDPTIPAPIAFPKTFPQNVLADLLAAKGLRQLHTAETEKYAHVTFFLNGGVEEPKDGEQRVLVASPKVATYDLQPEMSAPEVGEKLAAAIEADAADVYIVNFANCDMVGHTGSIPAATAAVEAVDAQLARVIGAIRAKGGVALVTADHGNADCMLAEDGTPYTAHSLNRVPFILVDASGTEPALGLAEAPQGRSGALCDIAPTLIDLIGIEKPSEWEGESLIVRN